MPDAGYHHSWSWINYISNYPNLKENISFACLADDKSVLAVCPLAISYNQKGDYCEISFGGNPCGAPLIASLKASMKRKMLDEIFRIILSVTDKYDVKKISMVWDPIVKSFCADASFHRGSFELLRYQMNYYVENVIVVNLSLPEETLFEHVSKYQRRHVQRSGKKGVAVNVFNIDNNAHDIEKLFGLFQESHFKSAGSMTRPLETWNAMKDYLLAGVASLFVAFLDNLPLSYLYCGEFSSMAFGWSQVNNEEYEAKYSPRHILEWKAMMFYKSRKFKYYEVGQRYYGHQLFHPTTEKEISISVLKERFGGFMLPKIIWTGYCDDKLFADELNAGVKEFATKLPVVKIPE
jgi:Acetyltransferase (GNAT) domain